MERCKKYYNPKYKFIIFKRNNWVQLFIRNIKLKRNAKFKPKYIFSKFYIMWENRRIVWFYQYNLKNYIIFSQYNFLNYKNPKTQITTKLYFTQILKTKKIGTWKKLKIYILKKELFIIWLNNLINQLNIINGCPRKIYL